MIRSKLQKHIQFKRNVVRIGDVHKYIYISDNGFCFVMDTLQDHFVFIIIFTIHSQTDQKHCPLDWICQTLQNKTHTGP